MSHTPHVGAHSRVNVAPAHHVLLFGARHPYLACSAPEMANLIYIIPRLQVFCGHACISLFRYECLIAL